MSYIIIQFSSEFMIFSDYFSGQNKALRGSSFRDRIMMIEGYFFKSFTIVIMTPWQIQKVEYIIQLSRDMTSNKQHKRYCCVGVSLKLRNYLIIRPHEILRNCFLKFQVDIICAKDFICRLYVNVSSHPFIYLLKFFNRFSASSDISKTYELSIRLLQTIHYMPIQTKFSYVFLFSERNSFCLNFV